MARDIADILESIDQSLKDIRRTLRRDPSFFTVDDVAQQLGIHANTVRRMIKAGRLQAERVGAGKQSCIRIPRTSLEALAGKPH